MRIRASSRTELRVALRHGRLAAHSTRPGKDCKTLRVEADNAEVIGRGAVFTVEAADSVLETTAVADGVCDVASARKRRQRELREQLERLLVECQGNIARMADRLGRDRATVVYHLRKFGLFERRERKP